MFKDKNQSSIRRLGACFTCKLKGFEPLTHKWQRYYQVAKYWRILHIFNKYSNYSEQQPPGKKTLHTELLIQKQSSNSILNVVLQNTAATTKGFNESFKVGINYLCWTFINSIYIIRHWWFMFKDYLVIQLPRYCSNNSYLCLFTRMVRTDQCFKYTVNTHVHFNGLLYWLVTIFP